MQDYNMRPFHTSLSSRTAPISCIEHGVDERDVELTHLVFSEAVARKSFQIQHVVVTVQCRSKEEFQWSSALCSGVVVCHPRTKYAVAAEKVEAAAWMI